MPTPDRLSADAIQTLVYIGELVTEQDALGHQIREHVSYARQQGASWRMIGVSLGTSAQSAWERYSGRERDSEVPMQEALMTPEEVMSQARFVFTPTAEQLSQVDAAAEMIRARAEL